MSEVMKLRNRITVFRAEIAAKERNHKAIKSKALDSSLAGRDEQAASLDQLAHEIMMEIDRMNETVDALEGMMGDAIRADALPQMKVMQKQYDELYKVSEAANQKLTEALEVAMSVLDDALTSAAKAEMIVRQSIQLSHDTGISGITERVFPFPRAQELEIAAAIGKRFGSAHMTLNSAKAGSIALANRLTDEKDVKRNGRESLAKFY